MEKTFYYVKQLNGDYLFDNFPIELKYLVLNFKESRNTIQISLDRKELKARIGLKKKL